MNRRDLILGGALGVAVGASAQAADSTKAGGAPYIPSNYGQTMDIMFTTSTDLNAFMPPGLTCVDPHRAFIKAERIKLRSPESDRMGPAFTQYHQVCITTMATTPQYGPRHRNILMWEDRAWAVGSSMLAVKRWAEVHMPYIFEKDHTLVAQGATVPFFVEVRRDGHPVLSFTGQFDGKKRVEHPAYPGFYVGGDPGSDLRALDLTGSDFSRPMYGTGTLKFGALPGERGAAGPGKSWPADLLKDIEVQGAIYQDFSFNRDRGSEFHLVRKATPGNGRSRF